MKILIYSHSFAPDIGGVETYVDALAEGLLRQYADRDESLEVTVATRSSRPGIDETAFPFRVVRRPTWSKWLKLIHGADVVHVAGPCLLPMILGLFLRKPVVVEHHGYQATCPN